MYQITQTSSNPDTADQLTAVYAAYSTDYCGDGWRQIFTPAYKSTPWIWGQKTAQIFSTYTWEYMV